MYLEQWIRQRVTQAVEAGDVPAELLAELGENLEATRTLPPEQRGRETVQALADALGLPAEQAAEALRAFNGLPAEAQDFALRRLVEAWLVWQGRAYKSEGGV